MRSNNDISAKFSALSTGEKIILIGSIVFVIAALILPWITVSVDGAAGFPGASESNTALGEPGALWGWLAMIVAIVLAGVVIARIMDMQLPALPPQYTWGQAFLAGAAALLVLTLLKAWRIQALDVDGGFGIEVGIDKSFGFGFFIGILAAIAVAAGGYLMFQEEKGASGFSGGFGMRR